MITEDQIRRVTLCIARARVAWGYRGPIELFRAQAINILENSKTAGDISDSWSQEYDRMWPERESVG